VALPVDAIVIEFKTFVELPIAKIPIVGLEQAAPALDVVVKSPKSVVFPVEAMVMYWIVFTAA
jgi:hypothetical protein